MAQVGIEVSFNDNDANKKAKDLVKSMGQLSTLVGEVDKKLEDVAQELSKTADGQKRLSETTQSYNKFLKETNKDFEAGIARMDNFRAKTEQLRQSTVNYTAQINALGKGLLSYQAIAKQQFVVEQKSLGISTKMAKERFDAQVEFNKVAGDAKATISALKYNDVLSETIKKVKEGMSVEEARKRASMEARGVASAVLEQQLKLERQIKREQQKEVVGNKLQQQRELIALLEKGYTVQQATERLNLKKQGYTQTEIQQHLKLNRLKDEAVARERMEAAIKAANLGVDKQITNLQNIMNVSKTRGLSIAQATLVVNLQEQGVELNKINLLVQQNALMDKMLAKERESLFLSQKKVAKPSGGIGLANKETGNSGFLNPSSFAAGGLVGGSLNKFFAGFSAAIIVAEVIKIADTMNLLDARMKLVSRTTDDLVQSKKDLTDIARETRSTLENVTTLYVRLYPPLERAGKTTEQIKAVTKAFGQTLLLSGANAREAASAYLQFSQAMAAGKLAGDEFRTVSEANPALLMAIANGAGVARSELKKMSADGLLTTEFVTEALEKQAEFINKMSQGLPITLQQSITNLRNEFSILVDNTNKATGFTNALSRSLETLTGFIKNTSSAVESASGLIGAMSTALGFVSDAFIPLLAGLVTYKLSVGAAAVGTGVLTGAVGALSTAFLALYSILLKNPFAILLAAVATAGVAIFSFFKGQKKAAEDAGKAQEGLTVAYDQSTKSLERQKVASEKLKKEFGALYEEQANLAKNNALTEEQARLLKTVTEQEEARIEALKKGKVGSEQLNTAMAQSAKVVANLKEEFRLLNIEAGVFSTVKLNKDALSDLNNSTEDNIAITKLATTTFKGLGKDAFEAAEKYYDLTKGIDLSTASMFEQQATQTAATVATYKFVDALKQRRAAEDALDPKKQKKSDAEKYGEEIAELQIVLSLLDKGLSIEEARLVSQGASISQTKQLLSLRKELSNQESFESLKQEIALEQQKNIILANRPTAMNAELEAKVALGLATQQQLDLENQLAAVRSFTSYKNEVEDLQEFLNLLSLGLTTKEADLEIERQRLAIKLASEGRTSEEIAELLNLLEYKRELVVVEQERAKVLEEIDKFIDSSFNIEIGDIFGESAKSANQFINVLQNITKSQEKYNEMKKAGFKDDKQAAAFGNARFKQQLSEIGSLLNATKGFFKEKSKGFKAISAIEKATQIASIALAVESLGVKLGLFQTETLAAVAKDGAIAASSAVAAAISSMVGLPFPLNLAALAATTAAIGALGVSLASGGSSSKSNTKALNRGKGIGTVLGDPKKESESLVKGVDILTDLQDKQLSVSSNMLSQLVLIKNGIVGFAASIFQFRQRTGARVRNVRVPEFNLADLTSLQPNLSQGTGVTARAGGFNTSAQFAQEFSTFLSRTLIDMTETISSASQLLGLSSGDFNAALINIPEILISGLRKLKGAELEERLQAVVGLIGDTIIQQAFSTESVYTVARRFRDQTNRLYEQGTTITQAEFNALTERQQRNIVESFITPLDAFQKAGEGLFETFIRVTSDIELANYELERFGIAAISFSDIIDTQGVVAVEIMRKSIADFEKASYGLDNGILALINTFQGTSEEFVDFYSTLLELRDGVIAVGKSAADLSREMIQGAGGADRLANGLQEYFDNYLTESEQAAEITRRVTAEFSKLNIAVPNSVEEFKQLIQGIDTTTDEGRKLFGSLIALTPEFSNLNDAVSSVGSNLQDVANDLYSTIRDARLQSLTPTQGLDFLLEEYQNFVNLANQSTGIELADRAGDVNNLIDPLLKAISGVYASGGEAQSLIDSVLGQAKSIADKVFEEGNSFENASLTLLKEQVDELERIRFLIQNSGAGSEIITSAKGNGFSSGKVIPFAKGGSFTNSVVSQPTLFPLGLMGEAGSEAIMPLARGSDGSLGVRIVSGGGSNSGVEAKLDENNRHSAALVTLQQAANKKIIEKLSEMEERLDGIESKGRLMASGE